MPKKQYLQESTHDKLLLLHLIWIVTYLIHIPDHLKWFLSNTLWSAILNYAIKWCQACWFWASCLFVYKYGLPPLKLSIIPLLSVIPSIIIFCRPLHCDMTYPFSIPFSYSLHNVLFFLNFVLSLSVHSPEALFSKFISQNFPPYSLIKFPSHRALQTT